MVVTGSGPRASAGATPWSSPARAPRSWSTTSAPSSTARGGSDGPAGEVVDEIRGRGRRGRRQRRRRRRLGGRRAPGRSRRRGVRRPRRGGQQRRRRARPHVRQRRRGRVGRRHAGPPQGPLRHRPPRRRLLAGPGEGRRRRRRPHHQHHLRRRAAWARVGQAAYSAAKGGIASLTLVQAAELGRYGVTANAIAPVGPHPHDRGRLRRRRWPTPDDPTRSTPWPRRTCRRSWSGWARRSRPASPAGCSRSRAARSSVADGWQPRHR